MAETSMLHIAGLRKKYGDFIALKDIDLDVGEGEFLAIVGPSGSGKTTLIKLLVGMEDQTEGSIWLKGKRLDFVPANKRPTCMVFQSLALFPHRSVGQNVEFPLKIKGISPAQRKKKALELLEMFRLPADYYHKSIGQCSGGEKQRIALARALAFDPEILFFDEPLSALDYRLRKTLEKELKDLHQRTGKTFIYITHSLEEAMVMSDRIAILNWGRFEQIGPAEEIYHHPKSRFVASFMGDVNLFDIKMDSTAGRLSIPGFSIADNVAGAMVVDPLAVNTLMVRPESVRLLEDSQTADFVTKGKILAKYMLGSRIQFEIEQGDIEPGGIEQDTKKVLIVEAPNYAADNNPGTTVRLGFSMSHTHLISEAA